MFAESDGSTASDARPHVDAESSADAHDVPDSSLLDGGAWHDAHVDPVPDGGFSFDAASPDAADAGCSNPGTPVLHPHAVAGAYCPFGPGDMPQVCGATQECCEPAAGSGSFSSCENAGTVCPTIGSAVWSCEETLDCTGSKVCCAAGTIALDPVCGFLRGSVALAASTCETSCGAGELHICASQAECPGGTTCTAFKVKGLELGACL